MPTRPRRRSVLAGAPRRRARRLVDLSLAEVGQHRRRNFMDVFLAMEPGVDAEPTDAPRWETPSIERTADGWVGFNTNAPHQIGASSA